MLPGAFFLTLAIGFALAGLAITVQTATWPVLVAAGWSSLAFGIAALSYFINFPLFGKQSDGSFRWWAIFSLPHLCLMAAASRLNKLRDEDPLNLIKPGLLAGRHLAAEEIQLLQAHNVTHVLDLTSELREHRKIREGFRYRCFPILDHACPRRSQFQEILNWPEAEQGVYYVHCAAGHGRAGILAAALLLDETQDFGQALQRAQEQRPGINPNPSQRRFLTGFFEGRGA